MTINRVIAGLAGIAAFVLLVSKQMAWEPALLFVALAVAIIVNPR